jgi:hypothetical protein
VCALVPVLLPVPVLLLVLPLLVIVSMPVLIIGNATSTSIAMYEHEPSFFVWGTGKWG